MSYDSEEAKRNLRATIEGQTPPVPKEPEIDHEEEKRWAAARHLFHEVLRAYRDTGHQIFQKGDRADIQDLEGKSCWIQVDPWKGLGYGVRGYPEPGTWAFLNYDPSKDVFYVPDFPEKNVITKITDDIKGLFI